MKREREMPELQADLRRIALHQIRDGVERGPADRAAQIDEHLQRHRRIRRTAAHRRVVDIVERADAPLFGDEDRFRSASDVLPENSRPLT